MSLKPTPANWQEAIHDAAIQFMTARVCFYEEGDVTPYDPVTGTGGSTEIDVIHSGKARVQHLRSPRDANTDYQANRSRQFRWQLDPDDGWPDEIPFGTKGRVLDGARDKALEGLVFVVDSAINSSDMAVRTVDLTSDMRFVEWDWTHSP